MARRRTPIARKPTWTRRHVERLLWRAGFGGSPQEVDHWARRSKKQLIDWLISGGRGPHGTAAMHGPEPRTEEGPLDPENEWGHDGLWWLDRMVRSQRPLEEKLTLFWHDHFATRDQDTPLMLQQNRTIRAHALGRFDELLTAITQDPAMALFLSLADSSRRDPNENYARELLELFTLGVDAGYTQQDVTEAARALTGFRSKELDTGITSLVFDETRHDNGVKTLLGRTGNLGWQDVLTQATTHPRHAAYLTAKLWAFFIPEPLDARTQAQLVATYTSTNRSIAATVRRILEHPKLYSHLDEPRLVKWPCVQIAGMLKAVGRGVDTGDWAWLSQQMGQELFSPPSVAGWDTGADWISTSTVHGRFNAATWICKEKPVAVRKNSTGVHWTPEQHLDRAKRATGRPFTTARTEARLIKLAKELLQAEGLRDGHPPDYMADLAQSALRHLLLSGPDNQLC